MKYALRAIAALALLSTAIQPVLADTPQGNISGTIEWSKSDGQPNIARNNRNPLVVTFNSGAAMCRKFDVFITAGKAPRDNGTLFSSSGVRLGNRPQFTYQDSGDRHICTYQLSELPEGGKLTVHLEAPTNWQYPATADPDARMSFSPVNNTQIVLQRDNIEAPAAAVVNFTGSLSRQPVIK